MKKRRPHTVCTRCGSTSNSISGGRSICNRCRNASRVPEPLPDPVVQEKPSKDWYKRAACLGADPSMFFDLTMGPARTICRSCPVREACLDAAVREEATLWPQGYRYLFGFRGGTSASERLKLVVAQVHRDGNHNRNVHVA